MERFPELTLEGIRLHPVWRYKSAGDDTVALAAVDDRPQLSEQDANTFVAATIFRLADGSELAGLLTV